MMAVSVTVLIVCFLLVVRGRFVSCVGRYGHRQGNPLFFTCQHHRARLDVFSEVRGSHLNFLRHIVLCFTIKANRTSESLKIAVIRFSTVLYVHMNKILLAVYTEGCGFERMVVLNAA